ncbi:MAG: PspA/IM30 family protein [Candidatus Vogelbacteria bacterium]|nr:PspA/IM30 family protein [Candidatus Vogelbacteria bacterium]
MKNPFKLLWRFICGTADSTVTYFENKQDPKKVLKQSIEEMRAEYTEYKKGGVEAEVALRGYEKELEKYKVQLRILNRKAEQAVADKNDALARAVLHKKKEVEMLVTMYEQNMKDQVMAVAQFRQQLEIREGKIASACGKQKVLETRSKVAEMSQKMAESRSSILAPSGEGGAFAEWDRAEAKIEEAMTRAEITTEISSREFSQQDEIKLLTNTTSDVDDELAALKQKLQLPEKTEKN